MLPTIDSDNGANFAQWSVADQQQLAAQVANAILQDPNARGVQLDIEPFDVATVPFYAKLRSLLNAGSKVVTVFTGDTSGAIYGSADVVVLAAYDLGLTSPTPSSYGTAVANMMATASASAQQARARLLVGIPVSASFEEYASETGTCTNSTGFTEEQWAGAALHALCPHYFDASYLGVALWEITDQPLQIPGGSGCLRHPDQISSATPALANGPPRLRDARFLAAQLVGQRRHEPAQALLVRSARACLPCRD